MRANLYVGIGIQISQNGEYSVIRKAFPRGPARRAKAKDGDKILKIDGVDVRGAGLAKVVTLLRGAKGTRLSVTVQHGALPPRELRMVRDVIPIDSVEGVTRRADDSWDFQLVQDVDVAFVKIVALKGSTVSEIRDAARRIEGLGAKAVIVDLTRCSGGEFRHAVMLADALIGEASLGEASLGGQIKRTGVSKHHSDGDLLFAGLPMAVLIGTNTSGPPEWLAAALHDTGRAPLIGEGTRGSGVVVSEIDLKSGFGLRVHSGLMTRSNGKPIQRPTRAVGVSGAPLVAVAPKRDVDEERSHNVASRIEGGVEPDVSAPALARIAAALKLLEDKTPKNKK